MEGAELPKPGDVLSGKYELVRLIGKGGMGVVYEALHLRLKQRVAIKVLKPDLTNPSDMIGRFEREGRAAARMTSAHVARIFDVDVTKDGLPYLVIEYLEGHDLSAELARRGKIPAAEAVDVVVQACSAMMEAHALGVVHRDLKPANLFLCGKGPSRIVKVLDFGISKVFDTEDIPMTTTPSLALGTPHYMSPEQILASKDVDMRSDIWSLGVILYKAVAGRFPFEGDSPTALVVAVATRDPTPLEEVEAVAPELARAVMKALAKERADRWSRVEDFARAIEPFGSGRVTFTPLVAPTSAPPGPPRGHADSLTLLDAPSADQPPTQGNWTQPAGLSRRGRWRAPMIGGVAAIAIGAIAFFVLATRHAPPPVQVLASPAPTRVDVPPPVAVDPPPPASALAPPASADPAKKPIATPVPRRWQPPRPAPLPPDPPTAPTPRKDPLHL